MSLRMGHSVRMRLTVESLESRLVPAGTRPISIPDSSGVYQLEQPTGMNLFTNVVDPNPGASLDFSKITIDTAPTKGRLDVDPNNGNFVYTPNYLIQNLPQPYPNLLPESFKFSIKDTVGASSNIATFTFNGSVAPTVGGFVVIPDQFVLTRSFESLSIDGLSQAVLNDGAQIDPTTVGIFPDFPNPTGIFTNLVPEHGSVSIDHTTGALTYTPDLGFTGADLFTFSVEDSIGHWGLGHIYIYTDPTAAPRLQADPLGGQMLVVDGTTGDDAISINPARHSGDVLVTVNGVTSGPFHPTGRIVVLGYGGDDTIQVSNRVPSPAWLVGGFGNDKLTAGGGPSILLGGSGNDTLTAGTGRDFLIGGIGSDAIIGTENDILVAGTTGFDNNPIALNSILAEWNSNHTYTERTQNLAGQVNKTTTKRLNGGYYLTPTTIQDDGDVDFLYGSSQRNLLYANVDGPNADLLIDTSTPGRRDTRKEHEACEKRVKQSCCKLALFASTCHATTDWPDLIICRKGHGRG